MRQVTQGEFTPPPPPPVIERAAARPQAKKAAKGQKAVEEMVWRRVEGAFLVTLVIKNREELLEPEERLLAWLRWIVQTLPQGSRWHPVWQRYLELIAGRVSGFGGDPGKIVPSSTGTVPHHGKPPYAGPTEEHRREFTGKVIGLIHDRFGDFDGFLLLTEHGDETLFRCREHAIERLAEQAWADRTVVSVFTEHPRPTCAV